MTDRHSGARVSREPPPEPSTIDLHTHTRRSDGLLEPAELAAQAYTAGVRLLAITDHDTLASYRRLRAAGSLPLGLELVPGVEVNAVAGGRDGFWESELHVLGFGMDPDDEAFESALEGQRGERRRRFERMRARLRELGMPVDAELERLRSDPDDGEDALGRPTLARALVARGDAESVEDAFQRWLAYGRPAWAPRDGLGPRAAIAAIRAAGGLPVLAHFAEARARIGVVRELVAAGLGGLEVYYLAWDRDTVASVGDVARELGLVATGGSDYHGDLGPYAEAHRGLWVPSEVGQRLRIAL
ncbi:MAG: PHP domain-containing protein, partial [Chloroflexota bacterium]